MDETYEPFVDAAYWDYLTDIADHEWSSSPSAVGPVDDGTTCDVTDPENWGDLDPAEPCGGYFPIIYFNQSVNISGNGVGQGILLVDGDLMISGNVNYVGIIIVKGEFDTFGTVNIYGGVIAYSTGNFASCHSSPSFAASKMLRKAAYSD